MRPFTLIGRWWQDEGGATAIEYGMLIAMVSLALVGIFTSVGALEALYDSLIAIAEAMSV